MDRKLATNSLGQTSGNTKLGKYLIGYVQQTDYPELGMTFGNMQQAGYPTLGMTSGMVRQTDHTKLGQNL
jgi:hypothetical protein